MTTGQKFSCGDSVRLTDAEMKRMACFIGPKVDMILVEGSYHDLCGGSSPLDKRQYGLAFFYKGERKNRVSWFDEKDMTLVSKRTLESIEMVEDAG